MLKLKYCTSLFVFVCLNIASPCLCLCVWILHLLVCVFEYCIFCFEICTQRLSLNWSSALPKAGRTRSFDEIDRRKYTPAGRIDEDMRFSSQAIDSDWSIDQQQHRQVESRHIDHGPPRVTRKQDRRSLSSLIFSQFCPHYRIIKLILGVSDQSTEAMQNTLINVTETWNVPLLMIRCNMWKVF